MKKLIFLMIIFLMGSYPLRADEASGVDQEFMQQLDDIKSPFDDGLPKPVIIQQPVVQQEAPPIIIDKPKPVPPPEIELPELKLDGVMVGDEMHQAIINDQVVPMGWSIKGARVYSVTKLGVGLIYKGKKFFLKVE